MSYRLCLLLVTLLVSASVARAEPRLPSDGLFKPTFLVSNSSWSAGTSFLVHGSDGKSVILVTCHHLFGPAAGLEQQLTPDDIAREVRGAVGLSMQVKKSIVVAPEYLKVSGAAPMSQKGADHDVAIFVVREAEKLNVFELSEKLPAVGDAVYLFARTLGADEPKLFRATIAESTATGLSYTFDDPKIELRGTSGAPVLNEQGQVVAMNLGGGEQGGKLFGIANPATAIRQVIRSAKH